MCAMVVAILLGELDIKHLPARPKRSAAIGGSPLIFRHAGSFLRKSGSHSKNSSTVCGWAGRGACSTGKWLQTAFMCLFRLRFSVCLSAVRYELNNAFFEIKGNCAIMPSEHSLSQPGLATSKHVFRPTINSQLILQQCYSKRQTSNIEEFILKGKIVP